MSELIQMIQNFNTAYPDLVTWVVVLLISVFFVVSQWKWINESLNEWELNRLLKGIGIESLHNVTIDDDIDGKLFIENLILLPNKILLLGVKKFKGVIFAADKIELWTQVIANKSYKFDNPLRYIETSASLLNTKTENTKIEGKVLFIKGSEFPKGKPEQILTIPELKNIRLSYNSLEVSDLMHSDWQALKNLVSSNVRGTDKKILRSEGSAKCLNLFSLILTIVSLSTWLFWRLI